MSLACIDFNWFLVVSGAVAAVMVIVSFSRCCFFLLTFAVFAVFALRWLEGVSGGFVGGSVATICANVGFASSFLMSFMSFDISSIVCCFSSSSSFSKFCAMVLAFSREALAFAMCVELGPVVVLTLLMSLITSLSSTSSIVMLGASGFCSFPLLGGVSGITVPERGSMGSLEGVALIMGVVRGRVGVLGRLIAVSGVKLV